MSSFMGLQETDTMTKGGADSATDRTQLSIVVPLFNEFEVFSELRSRLIELQVRVSTEYDVQIVLVDDGSSDNTWELIKSFAEECTFVKGISLSRNFGHQRALFCG